MHFQIVTKKPTLYINLAATVSSSENHKGAGVDLSFLFMYEKTCIKSNKEMCDKHVFQPWKRDKI